MLTVHVADAWIVVLPDEDVKLGVLRQDQKVEIGMKLIHGRPVYRAEVVPQSAPGSV